MLQSWSLKKKLIGYACLSTTFLIIAGGLALQSLRSVIEPFAMVAEHNLPKAEALSKLYLAQKDAVIAINRLIGNHATSDEAQAATLSMKTIKARIHEAQKRYESKYRNPDENELYQAALTTIEPFFAVADSIIELSGTGRPEDEDKRERLAREDLPKTREHFRERFDALLEMQEKRTAFRIRQAEEAERTSQASLTLTVLIGAALMFLFGYWMARTLSSALSNLADQLAGGADEVAAASSQLSGTSAELSAASNQQAAALQQTSASVQEISSMVARNSNNASASLESARNSQETADRGQDAMNDLASAIEEIQQSNGRIMEQVDQSNEQVSGIVRLIREIGEKTKVINDIVFQTRLLSFNASVEAARAGEHGKGFAVVAEEVGTLAQMSGNAAKEISTLLENSIKEVDGIVHSTKSNVHQLIEAGHTKVTAGTHIAERCAQVLHEIVGSSEVMTRSVSEIASASAEQAKGTEEISRAMAQLDQVTQQNTAASQQAADAATRLSDQADSLKTSVADLLRLLNGGSSFQHRSASREDVRRDERRRPEKRAA